MPCCLSRMDSDDPAEPLEQLEARFNPGTPETEVVLLRNLIRLECVEDGVLEHIKQFHELVGRLDRFRIIIPEKMLKVLLLEGLSRSFKHFWKKFSCKESIWSWRKSKCLRMKRMPMLWRRMTWSLRPLISQKKRLYTSLESSQQKGTEMLELHRQSHDERLHRWRN